MLLCQEALNALKQAILEEPIQGATYGMIRSFKAMAQQGMPDATQLALGISEALINTFGGLVIAQVGIIAYNYFVTRVDNFNYMMDEASYEAVQLLAASASERK